MFTGIIEEIGFIQKVTQGSKSASLTVRAKKILNDIKIGDSINTNGVCLTVTSIITNGFTVDIMAETLRNTNLSDLVLGQAVNLEQALSVNGRFGGHIVSGHIDGTGTIVHIKTENIATWFTIKADKSLMKYIVHKGSVAIDGISLTVAETSESGFKVSIIPHTQIQTTLMNKKDGDILNIECDIVGKYIEKFMIPGGTKNKENQIDYKFLSKYGFTS